MHIATNVHILYIVICLKKFKLIFNKPFKTKSSYDSHLPTWIIFIPIYKKKKFQFRKCAMFLRLIFLVCFLQNVL